MLLQAQAIGRLGGDPQTHSGDRWQLVSFSMATSHRKDETIWITVKAWGKLAELLADKLSKGQLVYASGRLVRREYDDRNGNPRESWELHADTVRLLGQGSEQRRAERRQARESAPADDEDIPF